MQLNYLNRLVAGSGNRIFWKHSNSLKGKKMKWFVFLTILAAGAVPVTVTARSDAGPASDNLTYGHLPYGCFGYPGFVPVIQISGDGVGQVLASITHSEKRQGLAEKWFQILEQSCTRSLDLQKGWLQLQQRHLELQKQIEQLRAEMLKLQEAAVAASGNMAEANCVGGNFSYHSLCVSS